MRRRLVGALGLVSVFALAAGCGSTSTDPSGSSIALGDLPKLLATSACQALSACYGAATSLALGGEDCQTKVEADFADALSTIQAAVSAGTAKYDGTRTQACLDLLASSGCNIDGALDSDTCHAALDGTVEIGKDCQNDAECKGSAYCKTSGSCPGACSERQAAGAPCNHDSECASGIKCGKASGVCEKPAAEGAVCGGGTAPECAGGLFCLGADEKSGKTGTCKAINQVFSAKVDEKCDPAAGPFCDPTLSCAIQSISGSTFSAQCVAMLAKDAPCKVGFLDACPSGQYCKAAPGSLDGTCSDLPGDGQPCASGPFGGAATLCAPYDRCDGATCRTLQNLGGTCSSDDVCHSQNCVSGKCAADGACH